MVDGPSAGLAMAAAMYSAITGSPIAGDAAMTGEISVNGYILPVGGVKAKLRAAERMGLRCVLIPWDNRSDASACKIDVIPVHTLSEALKLLNCTQEQVAKPTRPEGLLAAKAVEN